MERFYKESEFKEWLVSQKIAIESSAKSYCDYLNATKLNTESFDDFKKHFDSGNEEGIEQLTSDLLQLLSTDSFLKTTKYTPSYVKKWISAIPHYGFFLLETIDNELTIEVPQTINAELLPSENRITISKKVLATNFAFRLITQDRFYDDISYPISFIKRLFYKNNRKTDFDRWITKGTNEIKIFIDNKRNSVTFRQISDLILVDNNVFIIDSKGTEFKMFTPLANEELAEMKVALLRNITIDHRISVHKIMEQLKGQLPIIKSISDELVRHQQKPYTRKKINKKIREKSLFESVFVKQIDLDLLFHELELIEEKFELQLMDRIENIKKGKKTEAKLEADLG